MNGALDIQDVSKLYATSSGVTPEVIMSEKCCYQHGYYRAMGREVKISSYNTNTVNRKKTLNGLYIILHTLDFHYSNNCSKCPPSVHVMQYLNEHFPRH
jgi:hypothetical protein